MQGNGMRITTNNNASVKYGIGKGDFKVDDSTSNTIPRLNVSGSGLVTISGSIHLNPNPGGYAISGSSTSTGSFGSLFLHGGNTLKVDSTTNRFLVEGTTGGRGFMVRDTDDNASGSFYQHGQNTILETHGTNVQFKYRGSTKAYIDDDGQMHVSATANAAKPGYTFSTDTNTGMYHAGTDLLGLTTGGTERVRISSAGISTGDSNNYYFLNPGQYDGAHTAGLGWNKLQLGNNGFNNIVAGHHSSDSNAYLDFYTDNTTHPTGSIDGRHVMRMNHDGNICLLYTSPSPRDGLLSRMPSSA